MSAPISRPSRPDYGVDAPAVLRNLFLFGMLCLVAGLLLPRAVHLGHVSLELRPMLFGTAVLLLFESVMYLVYVKRGKFRHRDFLLAQHVWHGDEQVLDVGCGRGLLLAGAAKRLEALGGTGHATGIDVWSRVDMAGNSPEATERNLVLEGVAERCRLVSQPAQAMPFADASFDVAVSNLCLHNIADGDARRTAVRQIARVLKPGGEAILSDYKLTGEYAAVLGELGFSVTRRWGSVLWTFPPLRVVVARKPLEGAL